jgi:very-short-patch-repair endonuclease
LVAWSCGATSTQLFGRKDDAGDQFRRGPAIGWGAGDRGFDAPEYEIDSPAVAVTVPPPILDADSSQVSAILDVVNGRNVAIKGPPGTGKSQTIANLMAAALAEGKRVLFMAEKMAALDVVKNRLDRAGLAHFVLELHSTKAKKKDVLDDLARRLEQQSKLVALQAYLEYAATGRLEAGTTSGREPDSDFELFVADALRARGYSVACQVGVAGFYIDLAVRHPAYPHGYLAGIECDGVTYHSAKSARDRDTLRQEVLESLNWKLYRVWSTDWFSNPRDELGKLLGFLDGLLQKR